MKAHYDCFLISAVDYVLPSFQFLNGYIDDAVEPPPRHTFRHTIAHESPKSWKANILLPLPLWNDKMPWGALRQQYIRISICMYDEYQNAFRTRSWSFILGSRNSFVVFLVHMLFLLIFILFRHLNYLEYAIDIEVCLELKVDTYSFVI